MKIYRMLSALSLRAITTFCIALLLFISGPANAQDTYVPDWYMVSTMASFKPVTVPGTQRRVAQNDAELRARHMIYEYVGSMRISKGRTVNDVIAKDSRLRAKVLEYIRTAEVVDWNVNPACACVQVWVRVDLNVIRSFIALCGYN
jgi:hypothetical protein